jgi:hypothetical protein
MWKTEEINKYAETRKYALWPTKPLPTWSQKGKK